MSMLASACGEERQERLVSAGMARGQRHPLPPRSLQAAADAQLRAPPPARPTLAKSPGQKGSTFTPAALMSALILSSCNESDAQLPPAPARPSSGPAAMPRPAAILRRRGRAGPAPALTVTVTSSSCRMRAE